MLHVVSVKDGIKPWFERQQNSQSMGDYFCGYPGQVQWTKVKGMARPVPWLEMPGMQGLYPSEKYIYRVWGNYFPYLPYIIILHLFFFGW